MALTLSRSLSEWLFHGRRRAPEAALAPAGAARPSRLAVEFLTYAVDARGQVVPLVRGRSVATERLYTRRAEPRWIRLRSDRPVMATRAASPMNPPH